MFVERVFNILFIYQSSNIYIVSLLLKKIKFGKKLKDSIFNWLIHVSEMVSLSLIFNTILFIECFMESF